MTLLSFNHQITPSPSPLQQRAIKEAYQILYALAGADSKDHFIFTSSGAEAVNHAIFAAYIDITRKTGKNHFLCGSLDEAPAIMAMSRLKELGCVFQMVSASPEGYIQTKDFVETLTPRTAMLSLSLANALTGVLQPIEKIANLCRERGIFFHIDATHVLGKKEFSFSECGADVLTFDGPLEGTGGMFIRSGLEISPLILGGKEQEGLRAGALNVSLLLECAQWAKEEMSHCDHYCIEIARLRSIFEEKVCRESPQVKVLFSQQERVPQITSLIFPGISSDALFHGLKAKGLVATYGGNQLQQFVHILKACGLQAPECFSALSFAFSFSTAEEEITLAAEIIADVVKRLRKYSRHLIYE